MQAAGAFADMKPVRYLPFAFKSPTVPVIVVSLCAIACDKGPTAPSGVESETFLTFESDPGEYIGQGRTYTYGLNDAQWNARFESINGVEYVSIQIMQPPGIASGESFWWSLDFAAPRGRRLAAGTYDAATRFPFQPTTQPGLSFSGTGRGCNTLTGRFTITEIKLGPSNTVDRLRATFEQNCEGGSRALRGRVSIAANPWR